MNRLWIQIVGLGRAIKALHGFLYDYMRYVLYSARRGDMKDIVQRNYHAVKVYHSIEKSMSFSSRNNDSGWKAAHEVLRLLKIAQGTGRIGYHDRAAYMVLSTFLNMPENSRNDQAEFMKNELNNFTYSSPDKHGVTLLGFDDLTRGILDKPELFFLSRYSIREFSGVTVDTSIVERAVGLAMKTPSACNRQAWHVYYTSNPNTVDGILKYHNGHRGFREHINNLMIVAVDLKAYMAPVEHYQHWIDGGLFAMSLIYALHSLGVGSCCLNWSQSPSKDRLLRKVVNIEPNHTVIMLIAIGWPMQTNRVCASARRPLSEVFTILN